ncbi:zinc finger protein 629 [Chanos chanos]|uniref:Zinc finger protein 629 n=1 Tax=Chanos chanos TaxID=29144 RepID=A0A6J2VGK7_CHACN|nr:zinc finger protein 629-like [Chanos chanos]
MSLNSVDTHVQLASIMERFAKSALAEMTKIIDNDSAILRSEISRRQMEIESLWCKLQFAESELKAARQAKNRQIRSVGIQVSDDTPGQQAHLNDSDLDVHIIESETESFQIKEERPERESWNSREATGPEAQEGTVSWEEERDTPSTPEEGSEYNLPHDSKPSGVWDSPVTEEFSTNTVHRVEAAPDSVHIRPGPQSTSLYPASGEDVEMQPNPDAESNANVQQRHAAGIANYTANRSASPGAEPRFDPVRAAEKSSCCNLCGKTFTTRFYLKIHQRIHSGERPYTCPQCGKRFYCNSHLISHQRSHTGEKPYSCEECGKSYSHLNSLKLHQRSHTEEAAFGYW